MKPKYLVVRIYQFNSPSILETVDNEEDARALCEIYKRKDSNYEYVFYKLM